MVSGVAGRFLPLIPDLGVMMTPGATYFLLAGLARNPGGLPLEARRPDTADACACPMGRWTGGDQPILRGRSDQLSDLPAHRVRPNHPKNRRNPGDVRPTIPARRFSRKCYKTESASLSYIHSPNSHKAYAFASGRIN